MKVHERIRLYIVANGLILKSVAKKTGIKPERFYRILDGTSALHADEYEIICRNGLSIDHGYFFSEKFSLYENQGSDLQHGAYHNDRH